MQQPAKVDQHQIELLPDLRQRRFEPALPLGEVERLEAARPLKGLRRYRVFELRGPLPGVRTERVTNSQLKVDEPGGGGFVPPGSTRVVDLVQALAKLRTPTRDMIAVLQAIKADPKTLTLWLRVATSPHHQASARLTATG